MLARTGRGEDIRSRVGTDPALRSFLDDEYASWVSANNKAGQKDLDRIRANFGWLMGKRLSEITPQRIDRWRTKRRNAGIAANTINRDINTISGALTKAVAWKRIPAHPLRELKALEIADDKRVRYLSKLVMAGVDLNTVRELLGHSDIKTTLRYAHLAPAHKAEAVARLVGM